MLDRACYSLCNSSGCGREARDLTLALDLGPNPNPNPNPNPSPNRNPNPNPNPSPSPSTNPNNNSANPNPIQGARPARLHAILCARPVTTTRCAPETVLIYNSPNSMAIMALTASRKNAGTRRKKCESVFFFSQPNLPRFSPLTVTRKFWLQTLTARRLPGRAFRSHPRVQRSPTKLCRPRSPQRPRSPFQPAPSRSSGLATITWR